MNLTKNQLVEALRARASKYFAWEKAQNIERQAAEMLDIYEEISRVKTSTIDYQNEQIKLLLQENKRLKALLQARRVEFMED